MHHSHVPDDKHPHRRFVFGALVTLLCVALIELAAYVTSHFISDDLYYRPPTESEFAKALESRETLSPDDRQLGWLPDNGELTDSGARFSPSSSHLLTTCISLYGDSFTYAAEVTAAEAWGDLLAKKMRCGVNNYGVVGYGTDQAVLRHQLNVQDSAPVTILSVMLENIVRNINQDRTLIYGAGIQLKPRFTLQQSDLVFVPVPNVGPQDFASYIDSPANLLHHEYFLPGHTHLSKRRIVFPYLWHVPASVLLYHRVSQGMLNRIHGGPPWYVELYDKAHPSRALELTAALANKFAIDAAHRQQKPLVLLIPTAREILYFLETDQWIQRTLVKEIRAYDIDVIDLGEPLLNRFKRTSPDTDRLCEFFCTKPKILGGHYTAAGNKLLAETVAEVLMHSKWRRRLLETTSHRPTQATPTLREARQQY